LIEFIAMKTVCSFWPTLYVTTQRKYEISCFVKSLKFSVISCVVTVSLGNFVKSLNFGL